MKHAYSYSVVIPAYNEASAIGSVIKDILSGPLKEAEIVVVDDHSTDGTREAAAKYPVTLLRNVHNFGYGYSLKRGIAAAKHDHIIILDADGSYPVSSLAALVAEYEQGFDMVVGARQGMHYRGSLLKRVARFFFRALSEFATGRRIPDINSGCRVFRKDIAIRFFPTLSSGFSFTTTVTLAFMLNAYSVTYLPINYHKREGHSKVKYFRDTLRSLQIIVESIVFYNPLKIFLLLSLFVLAAGTIGVVVGVFASAWIGITVFLALALSILIFSIGLIGVFLRFSHAKATA